MQYLTKFALLVLLPLFGAAFLPHPPLPVPGRGGDPIYEKEHNDRFPPTEVGATTAPPHAFHISKCLLEYNEREQSVQISLHLFLDDLEEALRRQGADKLFLCTEKEAADAETHLQRYLNQRLIVRVNGKNRPYSFLGKEISEDLAAVWCYLEITDVAPFNQLSVTNTLMMEVFDDQKNIVSVFGPGKKQGLLLFQKGKDTESVSF